MNAVSPRDGPLSTYDRLVLALERELQDDEQVLWQASQLAQLEPRLFGTYIFAIPWTAFSVMWTVMATAATSSMSDGGPGWIAWAFPLFGLPFIVIGLGMLALPWVPLMQKGRVLYAVTTKRVLRLGLGRELEVKAVPGRRIGMIERREGRDGTGVLRIAVKIGQDSDGDPRTEFFELGRIADVMSAHHAVNQLAALRAG